MPERKPHILMLINDEHRPDVMPVEGNPHIRTPTLDWMIDGGFYFRNAYTPSPICVPARQAFLSGLYPRNCGCANFGDAMPSEVLTIPGHLSRYGYTTCAAGKMHFVGPDQMHGWHQRIGRDIVGRNGYEPADDPEHQALIERDPGTGSWPDKVKQEVRYARAGRGHWLQHDRYSVDGALMYLDEHFVNEPYDRTNPSPLLMAVSLWSPHYPYQCPDDLFAYYLRRVKPYEEDVPEDFECPDFFKVEVGKDVTYREAHRATAAYYGMIEWMDAQFARVIDKLRELDVLDDFAIVFLSDHGEMLGQKGLWEKQQYFEGSARVPFAVRWPQRYPNGGATVQRNVSLVDLFPTLCDIANVPIPEGLDGRSVVPLMEGRDEDWPDDVYSELWAVHNGPSVMVKHGDMKLFRFDGHEGTPGLGPDCPEQLFDLARDPDETRNLIDHPDYADRLADLRARLDALPDPRKKDANNRFVGTEREPFVGRGGRAKPRARGISDIGFPIG